MAIGRCVAVRSAVDDDVATGVGLRLPGLGWVQPTWEVQHEQREI